MKKNLFLLFIVMSHLAFSQPPAKPNQKAACPGCQGIKPSSALGNKKAQRRIDNFLNLKFQALGDPYETKELNYSAQSFLDLLIALTSEKDGSGKMLYDGLRAYFAVDPGTRKISLIFVPTIRNAADKSIHDDDLKYCWIIANNQLKTLPLDDARIWTSEYAGKQKARLDVDGIKHTHNKNFEETRSLWYDIKHIKDKNDKGLICYLQYLICSGDVTGLTIKFGSFPRIATPIKGINFLKYWYHLTLVFNFHPAFLKGKALQYQTFSLNLTTLSAGDGGSNTDTGDPCPPYPPSSPGKCPGTKL